MFRQAVQQIQRTCHIWYVWCVKNKVLPHSNHSIKHSILYCKRGDITEYFLVTNVDIK